MHPNVATLLKKFLVNINDLHSFLKLFFLNLTFICLKHVFPGIPHGAADSGTPGFVIDIHDGGLHASDSAVLIQIVDGPLGALETHDPHPDITGVDVQSGHRVPQGF